MKKATKKWLIASLVLIFAGAGIVAAVTVHVDMDYSRLNTLNYVADTTDITETFDSIIIKTGSSDVTFVPSENGSCKVTCRDCEGLTHTVSVKDGTLSVTENDTRSPVDKISFYVSSPETGITVCLPAGEYGRLQINDGNGSVIIPDNFCFADISVSGENGKVECSAGVKNNVEIDTYSGDIELSGVNAKNIKLSSYSGEINLKDITCCEDCTAKNVTGDVRAENVDCRSFFSNAYSGEARLKNVIAKVRMDVQRETGDILLNASDAGELYLKTESGSVSGTILTEKVFLTETVSGAVNVPKTAKGGKCEIITNYGDVNISVK